MFEIGSVVRDTAVCIWHNLCVSTALPLPRAILKWLAKLKYVQTENICNFHPNASYDRVKVVSVSTASKEKKADI